MGFAIRGSITAWRGWLSYLAVLYLRNILWEICIWGVICWGSCSLIHGREFGKKWAPGKCKFFMWLVAHNKVLNSRPPHKKRAASSWMLCDQDKETIDHQLCSCVFSCHVWYRVLHKVGVQDLSPRPEKSVYIKFYIKSSPATYVMRSNIN